MDSILETLMASSEIVQTSVITTPDYRCYKLFIALARFVAVNSKQEIEN